MSGGAFNYTNGSVAEEMVGQWRDEELNELFFDMFGAGYSGYRMPWSDRGRECEFGPRGGGLAESLDFWLSGDTCEEDYRDDVERFKRKWLAKRTPRNRVEFYQKRFEDYARAIVDKFKEELDV